MRVEEVIGRLEELIREGETLEPGLLRYTELGTVYDGVSVSQHGHWELRCDHELRSLFGKESNSCKEWQNASMHRIEKRILKQLAVLRVTLEEFRKGILAQEGASAEMAPPKSKRVWVVHGRDVSLRDEVYNFLGSIGLKPIEFSEALALTEKGSPYIGEALDAAFDEAQAVVVLLTGDDVARLREEYVKPDDENYERNPIPQPRPNVLFEAGMAFGRRAEKTILVQVGYIRPISDLVGRHVLKLDNTEEMRRQFVKKLETVGCDVDTSGDDWLEVGNFEPTMEEPETAPRGEAKQFETIPIQEVLERVARTLSNLKSGQSVCYHRHWINESGDRVIVMYWIDSFQYRVEADLQGNVLTVKPASDEDFFGG